jgi:hypothetical protein
VEDENKPHRSRLDVILNDYDCVEDAEALWPDKAITVGLPRGYDWQMAATKGEDVVPVKKVIQKPSYIKMARLSEKKVVKG